MISTTQQRVVGKPLDRIDGPKKVTGTAPYAYEYSPDDVTYAFPVQSTIAKGASYPWRHYRAHTRECAASQRAGG